MANVSSDNVAAFQSTEDLLSAHKLLRLELSSIAHWRRLLRARIDLCTANVVAPLALGGQLSEYFDASEFERTEDIADLPATILTGLDFFRAGSLPELQQCDVTLRRYERSVRAKFMELSDELAQRHSR